MNRDFGQTGEPSLPTGPPEQMFLGPLNNGPGSNGVGNGLGGGPGNQNGAGGVFTGGLGSLRIWEADTSYMFAGMVDTRWLELIVFYIESLADQEVTAQMIGARDNVISLQSAVTIGDGEKLPAGNSGVTVISLGPKLYDGDWHPWMGVIVTTSASAPSDGGVISAEAWYRTKGGGVFRQRDELTVGS